MIPNYRLGGKKYQTLLATFSDFATYSLIY